MFKVQFVLRYTSVRVQYYILYVDRCVVIQIVRGADLLYNFYVESCQGHYQSKTVLTHLHCCVDSLIAEVTIFSGLTTAQNS
jgi:hypothetical protein